MNALEGTYVTHGLTPGLSNSGLRTTDEEPSHDRTYCPRDPRRDLRPGHPGSHLVPGCPVPGARQWRADRWGTARFLTLHAPAGFERFATEVGEPARALTLPPPPAGPPDFAALAQAAARYQITILAPPPQP